MPAPGTVWAANTWDANAWAANVWADAVEPPETTGGAGADSIRYIVRPYLAVKRRQEATNG